MENDKEDFICSLTDNQAHSCVQHKDRGLERLVLPNKRSWDSESLKYLIQCLDEHVVVYILTIQFSCYIHFRVNGWNSHFSTTHGLFSMLPTPKCLCTNTVFVFYATRVINSLYISINKCCELSLSPLSTKSFGHEMLIWMWGTQITFKVMLLSFLLKGWSFPFRKEMVHMNVVISCICSHTKWFKMKKLTMS